jgi:hypothetical protein
MVSRKNDERVGLRAMVHVWASWRELVICTGRMGRNRARKAKRMYTDGLLRRALRSWREDTRIR